MEGRQSCEGCGALYHRECLLEELGRCAVLGCGAGVDLASGTGPFFVAVRQLLRAVAQQLPGVEQVASPPAELRPGETPLGRVRTAGAPFVLTDVGVWRDETLCLDYAQIASVDCDPEGLTVKLGLQGERFRFAPSVDPADRLAALALERILGPLASFVGPRLLDRCPRCLAAAARDASLLACEGCGVAYHPACLREAGACSTPRCGGTRAVPRPARDWLQTLGRPRPDVPLVASAPPDADRCARCARAFVTGDGTYLCVGCGAALHADCMQAQGRCLTAGCAATAADPCRYGKRPGSGTLLGALVGIVGLIFLSGLGLLASGGAAFDGLVLLIVGGAGLGAWALVDGALTTHQPVGPGGGTRP